MFFRNHKKKVYRNKRKKFNVICFSFMPWSNMWKRNQSMMAELSKFDFINKIIFINPVDYLRSTIKFKKGLLNSIIELYFKLVPKKRMAKIVEYTPVECLPLKSYFNVLKKIEDWIILKRIKKLNKDMPYILFMNCPNIFSNYVLDELLNKNSLSIFDFSDDFVQLVSTETYKKIYLYNMTKYAGLSDIVLTVNNYLKDKYEYLNSNIHVLKNSTNYYNFERTRYKPVKFMEQLKEKNMPIIGYSGIINYSRLDENILNYLFEKCLQWQFVFIGQADKKFIEKSMNYSNVHHIPPVDYQFLPDYLYYFNAAIVPFAINEHTKGNNLLKFHDYLAMGKPIVSTEIGGVEDYKDVINIAYTAHDFMIKIENEVSMDSIENIKLRKKIASENSWHIRIKELESLILKYNL